MALADAQGKVERFRGLQPAICDEVDAQLAALDRRLEQLEEQEDVDPRAVTQLAGDLAGVRAELDRLFPED